MCPACQEPLIVFELDGVEIDRCMKCGGTWLDAGELDQLARLGGGAPDPFDEALAKADAAHSTDRRCVRCSARMKALSVHSVEIDRCPRGHGNWFDRSELESLLGAYKDGGVAKFLGQLQSGQNKKGD